MDQIELYRDTRDSIMQGLEPESWTQMSDAARDRALLAELKAEGNLHPALYPHEDQHLALGHFKVGQPCPYSLVPSIHNCKAVFLAVDLAAHTY